MRYLLAVMWMILAGAAAIRPAWAQDFGYLARASLGYNDVLFDGDDRWQTWGTTHSFLFGPDGTLGLAGAPGQIFELRLHGQMISPDNFEAPASWDRRAASVATATLQTHFLSGGFEVSAGAGLAATGPMVPLIKLQNFVHTLTRADDPLVPDAVQAAQIPNGIYPTVLGEVARRFQLSERIDLRPFVEAQTGVETYLRVGADLFVGGAWTTGILAREGTTGFAYQGLKDTVPNGFSFTLGADAARVMSSALLPSAAYSLTPVRLRTRAGMQYKRGRATVFAGVAWLGPEFAAQPTGQAVTALKLKWDF